MTASTSVLLLLSAATAAVVVEGCGISTHTEIGHRALAFFLPEVEQGGYLRDLLLRHQDAFQAGHPFPDLFYNSLCYGGAYHDRSEDTHWGHYVKVDTHI